MMKRLQLKLIGNPRLFLDETEVEIRTRTVLELLAVILASGPGGISRGAVADRLWGHLPTSNAKNQMRIAIHRLREESKRMGIDQLLELDSGLLKYTEEVEIDYLKVHPTVIKTVNDLQGVLCPLVDGWNSDHWTREIDEFGELVGGALLSFPTAKFQQSEWQNVLELATRIHPTTISIHLLLIKHLRSLHKEAEANEAIIRFEENWVTRFGYNEIPDLSKISTQQLVSEQSNRPLKWVRIVGAGIALTALSLNIALLNSHRSTTLQSIVVPPVETAKFEEFLFQGHRYRLTTFRVKNAVLENPVSFTDGSVEFVETFNTENDIHHQRLRVTRSGARRTDQDSLKLLDRVNHSKVFLEDGKAIVKSGSTTNIINGESTMPNICEARFLDYTSLIYGEVCKHPYADHRRPLLWNGGRTIPLDKDLAKPQLTVYSLITKESVYLKYSVGRREYWHNHVARFDFKDSSTHLLECSPVCGISSKGTLITTPEDTTIVNGDCDTQWNHTIELISSHGQKRKLAINGQTVFNAFFWLGDFIITSTYRTGAFCFTAVSAIEPNEGVPFNFPQRIKFIESTPDGRTLLCCPFNETHASDTYLLYQEID